MSGLTSRMVDPKRANTAHAYFDTGDHVVGLSWSPDGSRLAALTGAGTLFLLDARDTRPLHRIDAAHAAGALCLD